MSLKSLAMIGPNDPLKRPGAVPIVCQSDVCRLANSGLV
jgi:hypothetical protein